MEKIDLILESALHLFVEFGFHGSPTSRIAQNAGVSNGTLFHYFRTKNDLIVELYVRIKNELNKYIASQILENDGIKDKFRKTFEASVHWAIQNTEKFLYIQQVYSTPNIALIPESVKNELIVMHKKLLAEAVSKKIFKDIPMDFIIAIFSGHFTGVINYVRNLPEKKRESAIDSGFELFWKMIAAE